jgi:anaerobic magnesium-protoporphyrin IX monomethyl ester cyclase
MSAPVSARPLVLLLRVAERIGQLHLKNLQPPVGLLSLAAVLDRMDTRVVVKDMILDAPLVADAVDLIRALRPDLVGLSVMTINVGVFDALARAIDETFPGLPVIVGGPHATSFPEEAVAAPGIRCAVLGEGEATLEELVPAVLQGRSLEGIRGIAYRAGGEVLETPRRPALEPEDFPSIPWHSIGLERYWRHPSMTVKGAHRYLPLVSSRGCPYRCTYCHNIFGKKFRARSASSLFEEVLRARAVWGVRDFEIIDDAFNIDRARVHEFCRLVIDSGRDLAFSLPNGVRGDLLDEETLVLLARAGFDQISWAVETASPRLQKRIGKHNDLDVLRRNMTIAHRLGIFNYAFFMLGFPTETRREMDETVAMAMAVDADIVSFFRVIPYKGTPLWDEVPEALRRDHQPFDRAGFMLSSGGFGLSEVPDAEILRIQRAALRRFYGDPRRILRILRKAPRPLGLLDYSRFYLGNMLAPGLLERRGRA